MCMEGFGLRAQPTKEYEYKDMSKLRKVITINQALFAKHMTICQNNIFQVKAFLFRQGHVQWNEDSFGK